LVLSLLSDSFNLLLLELQLLVVLERSGQLTQILSQRGIFKSQLVNCSSVLVNMVYYSSVLGVNVELGLQTVVFFVHKIDLGLQFINYFIVLFLVVLHGQLVVVL